MFNYTYIDHESNNRYKNLSLAEYLQEIQPFLKDLINKLRKIDK